MNPLPIAHQAQQPEMGIGASIGTLL